MNRAEQYCQTIKRMSQNFAAILPPEYQQVDYLIGTGSQYINTGILAQGSFNVNIQYQRFGINQFQLFGSQTNNNEKCIKFYILSNGSNTWRFNNVSYGATQLQTTDYKVHTLTGNVNGVTFDGITYSMPSTMFADGTSIYVFDINGVSTYGKFYGAIYSVKITDGAAAVIDLVPCYRKSDGKPGMFDVVTKTFFTNAGTGEFLTGNDTVKLPAEYQRVDYLESSGSQYIDTGIAANSNVQTIGIGRIVTRAAAADILIGARNNGNNNGRYLPYAIYIEDYGYNMRLCYGSEDSMGTISTQNILKIEYNNANHEFVINGNTAASFSGATFDNSNPQNIWLFAGSGYNTPTQFASKGRLMYVQLSDNTTSSVLRNMLPCYRKSDNKPGMFDTVTSTFFINAGSGEFTVGNTL